MPKKGITIETEGPLEKNRLGQVKNPKLKIDPELYVGFMTYRVGEDIIGHVVAPANWDPNGRIGIIEQRINPRERSITPTKPSPTPEMLDRIFDPSRLSEPNEVKKFSYGLSPEQTVLARGYPKISEALVHLTMPDEIKRFEDFGFSLTPADYRHLIVAMHQQLQTLPS